MILIIIKIILIRQNIRKKSYKIPHPLINSKLRLINRTKPIGTTQWK